MRQGFHERIQGGKQGVGLPSLLLVVLVWLAAPGGAALAEEADTAPPDSLQIVTPVKSCQDLAGTDLVEIGGKGSRVLNAEQGERDGIAGCTVTGLLAPAIRFQTFLPEKTWRQRYLQVGCGGLCGRITPRVGAADGCEPLTHGEFVIAATDMGHEGDGGEFARDPQKREDFAQRAQHLTALASKALIKAFYGQPVAYSYFSGCSDGGREALIEAQRFPQDFNGIVAGAMAMNFQVQNSLHHGWLAVSNTGRDGKPIVLASRLLLIHQAVLDKCDALDGLEDGLLTDPRVCHFDPGVLQCTDARSHEDPACLSAAEVAAVRKFYSGPSDPGTGIRLTPGAGEEMPGSEIAWAGVFVPFSSDEPIGSRRIALDALRNLIFPTNPPAGYDLSGLRFDLATFNQLRAHHPLFDATNPDLSPFASAGGKLILWHGLADPHISPYNTIAYQEALWRTLGKDKVASFERLYLFPGVHHCGNGEGPDQFDLLSPIMAWVEQGKAPYAIIARQEPHHEDHSGFGQPGPGPAPSGASDKPEVAPQMTKMMQAMQELEPGREFPRSRPVYPYPEIAVYDGVGNPDQADSFHAGKPLTTEETPKWAGSDFFMPYVPTIR